MPDGFVVGVISGECLDIQHPCLFSGCAYEFQNSILLTVISTYRNGACKSLWMRPSGGRGKAND